MGLLDYLRQRIISIHSLRMEGDQDREAAYGGRSHFNPLPPHGGRPRPVPADDLRQQISIHSLRMEGDWGFWIYFYSTDPFQSTPSAWRETAEKGGLILRFIISIHSLRMEGDHLSRPQKSQA